MTGLIPEKEFSRALVHQRRRCARGSGSVPRVRPSRQVPTRRATAALSLTSLDSWLIVHADNTVTVLGEKLEYGQGTTTGLRQIAAEELGLSFEQTRWVRAVTGVTPNQGGTYGSNGTASGGPQIRAAAAYGAQALLGLASAQLGVPVASLTVDQGVVSGGGKSVKYCDLLAGKLFNVTMPATTLEPRQRARKSPDAYRVVGTRVPKVGHPGEGRGHVHVYAQRTCAGNAPRTGRPSSWSVGLQGGRADHFGRPDLGQSHRERPGDQEERLPRRCRAARIRRDPGRGSAQGEVARHPDAARQRGRLEPDACAGRRRVDCQLSPRGFRRRGSRARFGRADNVRPPTGSPIRFTVRSARTVRSRMSGRARRRSSARRRTST